jgi:hypothetical protein
MTIPVINPRPDDTLTEAQLAFFRAFGYLVLRNRIPVEEVRALERELLDEGKRQGTFDFKSRQGVVLMEPTCRRWCDAFASGRFVTPARQILGEDCIGMGTDGNRYVGDTPWHPDHAHHPYPQRGIKWAIYLGPVTATTGALRVIPGSHLQAYPVPNSLRQEIARFPIQDVPAVTLESQPGDAVVFDVRLWHGSCGGSDDRRMGTFVYYAGPRDHAEREEFRLMGEEQVRILKACGFRSYMFSAAYIADCKSRSPLRAQWMERLMELGYAIPNGTIEAPATATR